MGHSDSSDSRRASHKQSHGVGQRVRRSSSTRAPSASERQRLQRKRILVWAQVVFVSFLYLALLVWGIVALYKGYLTPYFEWLAGIGLWGNLLIVLSFIPASLPFLIGYTPLTLASGFIYGLELGAITSEIGAVLGAVVAFWLTRRLARDRILRMVEKKPQFRAFMNAVSRHGFMLVALLRCAPIPFGVQNGAFAVSDISFQRYTVATIVGLIPEQLMFCYFGTTLHDLADVMNGHSEMSPLQTKILYAQLVLAFAIFFFLAYLGRRAMRYADSETLETVDVQLEEYPMTAATSPSIRSRHV